MITAIIAIIICILLSGFSFIALIICNGIAILFKKSRVVQDGCEILRICYLVITGFASIIGAVLILILAVLRHQ